MGELMGSRGVDVEALAADEVRAAYLKKIEAEARQRRVARVADLSARTPAIEGAVSAYVDLDNLPPRVGVDRLGVRAAYPRKLPPRLGGPPDPEGLSSRLVNASREASTPALIRVAQRRGHSLNSYLSMMLVQQADGSTVNLRPTVIPKRFGRTAWADLCGRAAARDSPAARRQRMRRDLAGLDRVGLVELSRRGAGRTIEKFSYLAGPGHPTGAAFVVPPATVVELPVNFFLHGWHLVLSQAELAALLVLRDGVEAWDHPDHWGHFGLTLTQHMRHQWYGISSEAWESLHELREFGLVGHFDSMPHRRRGKIQKATEEQDQEDQEFSLAPEPYEWWPLGDEVFDRYALDVVLERLRDSELPPRLNEDWTDVVSLNTTTHPAHPRFRLLPPEAGSDTKDPPF